MLCHGLQNIPVHELTAVVVILLPDTEMMAYVETGVEDAEGHGGTVRDVGWHVSQQLLGSVSAKTIPKVNLLVELKY